MLEITVSGYRIRFAYVQSLSDHGQKERDISLSSDVS